MGKSIKGKSLGEGIRQRANGSYEESWEEIQGGLNSLGRYTNFNLFFTDKAKNPK